MIEMYDPKREYNEHKKEIDNSIQTVLNHGYFINGPEILDLEKILANFVGSKNCITVANGTDAIMISLMALGIKSHDEVITVSYSWISTAEVISVIKAIPIFVDIEEKTFNIDYKKIESKITEKTKAIIVVSLYGNIANIDKINEIGEKYKIPIIEDGAQSFGSIYNSKRSCSMTTIGTTSFFPSKPLGCYGDGGACFTNDTELAIKIRSIKNHGGLKRFSHKFIGLNSRLDTLQASILIEKMKYFEETLKKRTACAKYYSDNLYFLENHGFKLPYIEDNIKSSWAQYSILAQNEKQRDKIINYLKENNVNVSIFYSSPLHKQECFQYLYNETNYPNLPVTEKVCNLVFNLPCYAELTNNEQDTIINLLLNFI